jgi:hypothetical protein
VSQTLRTITLSLAAFALLSHSSNALPQATIELSWGQVHLAGMHLSLISPTKPGESLHLRFSEKYVAIDSCARGYCTGPLSVWKIEWNRLKIGYTTDEGDALIGVSQSKLVLKDKNGQVYTYAIVPP